MTGSLHYRKNVDSIRNGGVPEKYTRLLPYIPGRKILEFGAAEGVQALLLAEQGREVIAVEASRERHEEALLLAGRWLKLGRKVATCTMIHGDIRNNLDLLKGIETLVAIRTIYHLREDAPTIMAAAAAAGVEHIVLVGNKNRAYRYENGLTPHDDGLGEWNRWSSLPGMKELLEGAGYRADVVVTEGDPIVTGRLG